MTTTVAEAFGVGPITRTADHRYRYEDIWYPSVTTVLGALGANFSTAARYGANQCAEVVADMVEAGALQATWEAQGREGFTKGIAGAAVKRRNEAAQLGTQVHALAELVAHGQPLPAELTPVQRQRAEHYARWWERSGWKVRLTEAMIVTPQTEHQPGWAGTLDLLAYDQDGKTVLADVKTGKGIYREAVLQMAAYGMGRWVQPDGGTQVYPNPTPDRYVILHVTADGCRPVEVNIGTPEHMAFLSCLDIYMWTESQKGVKL